MADRKYQTYTPRPTATSPSNRQVPSHIAQGYTNIPWIPQQQASHGTQGQHAFIIPNMFIKQNYATGPIPQQHTGSSTSSSSGNESHSASAVDIASLPSHAETERWLRRTTGIPDTLPLNLSSYELAKNGPLGRSGHDLRVRLAIWGSSQKRMKLEEIDDVLKRHFADYSPKWKDSIRHMLTLKKHFVLEPVDTAEQTAMSMIPRTTSAKTKGGKQGSYWRLDLRGDSKLTRARKRRAPGSRQDDDSSESNYDHDEDMQSGQALQGNPYFPSAIQNLNPFDLQPFIPSIYQSDATMQDIVDMSSLHPSMHNNNRPLDFLHSSNMFTPSGSSYSSPSASHPFSPSPATSSTYNRSPSAPLSTQSMLNFPHGMDYMTGFPSGDMTFLPNASNDPQFSNAASGQYGYGPGRRRYTVD